MDFAPARPARQPRESIVPMINVVFLLLVFFLMTAQIAPPEPFPVTPPDAADSSPSTASDIVLFVAADGTPARDGVVGDAALAGLPPGTPLTIRADRALPAPALARLLARLAAQGVTDVALITRGAR